MTYDGYLTLGGVEIINTERARAYMERAACDLDWLKEAECEGMQDVLGALEGAPINEDYDVTQAPWYDQAQPELSERFYGVSGVRIRGVYDSTRTADVTESIGAGGTIETPRRSTREIRATALLYAKGRDALNFGARWLDAALDPSACGRHGDNCGTTDLQLFTECPPVRDEGPRAGEWTPNAVNYATNPGPYSLDEQWGVNFPNLWTYEIDPEGFARYQATGTSSILYTGIPDGAVTEEELFPAAVPIDVPEGEQLYVSAEMRSSRGGNAQFVIFFYDGAGEVIDTPFSVQAVNQNEWTTLSLALTVPASASYVLVTVATSVPGSNFVTGDTVDVRRRLITDGNPAEDVPWVETRRNLFVNPAATSTTNFSTSGSQATLSNDGSATRYTLATAGAVNVGLAVGGVAAGDYARVLVRARANDPILAQPRIRNAHAGPAVYIAEDWQWFEWRGIAGAGANNQTGFVLSANAGHAPDDWIEIDRVLVADGDDEGPWFSGATANTPTRRTSWAGSANSSASIMEERDLSVLYFDGNSPPEADPGTDIENVRYIWEGAAGASRSIRQVREILPPLTDEEYLDLVDESRRWLHDVGTVSGPLENDLVGRNGYWLMEVEFTLRAERPYIYSKPTPVEIIPGQVTAVSDVPYNLMVHPNANVSDGIERVFATNYAVNGSVEYGTADWGGFLPTGSFQGGTSSREASTELAAVGTTSFRAIGTATTAGAGAGGITVRYGSVDIPEGTTISVSAWAAALPPNPAVCVPESVLMRIEWLDDNGDFLEMSDWGLPGSELPAALFSGGHLSISSIRGPEGAARVIIWVFSTWQTAGVGAVGRLYVDAVSVTVP